MRFASLRFFKHLLYTPIRVGPNSEHAPNTELFVFNSRWAILVILCSLIHWLNKTRDYFSVSRMCTSVVSYYNSSSCLKMIEYQILISTIRSQLFEYRILKLNSSPPKFICELCDQMSWGKFDPLFSFLPNTDIWIEFKIFGPTSFPRVDGFQTWSKIS